MNDPIKLLEQELSQAKKTLQKQQQDLEELLLEKYEPIAVVGVGLRFPGHCDTIDSFADLLQQGRAGTGLIPKDRWDNDLYYTEQSGVQGKISTSGGGFIDNHDNFDAKFFSISPKEAQYIDPQQRVVMQVACEALENANIPNEKLVDGGVFIGVSSMDQSNQAVDLPAEGLANHLGTGIALSAIAGRLSYFLGWRGPSLSIDTACSSSLVALHSAISALRKKECSIAISGGVNVIQHPMNHMILSSANMLAPDGRCKTFDEKADGYSRSEGCGIVVLKRLSDAIGDGDNVIALLRGSAVKQDGSSGGLTVPNGLAQEQVMADALANSALSSADINYVEAHGTGTSLGDPIEVRAINEVFGAQFDKQNPIPVGSVKTNIGHMEAAAGMGGLIKVILQIQNSQLYPHINLETPSSQIPWDTYSISIPQENQPWSTACKRAMINSFGFAGTIAAVVIQEPPSHSSITKPSQNFVDNHLFSLSAKSQSAFINLLRSYQSLLTQKERQQDLAAICYTSQVGRDHYNYRVASQVSTLEELKLLIDKTLTILSVQGESAQKFNTSYTSLKPAMLFTGQGSQYVGMAASLYEQIPLFKHYIDVCDQSFKSYYDQMSIKEIMFGTDVNNETLINETQFTQPVLFSVEYAMAMILIRWGVEPAVLIGHSIGEIVAACVAGLFTLNDAIKLVAKRAQLMQSVKQNGGMTALKATQNQVASIINDIDDIAFAAINSPSQCVISGASESLQEIHKQLDQRNIEYTVLPVSHAFHSPLMAEVFGEFRKVFSEINFNKPKITLISNLSGDIADIKQMQTADYWIRHIAEPVHFSRGMQTIENRGEHLFIEVGPSAALTALGKQSVKGPHRWVATLDKKQDSMISLLQAIAQMYNNGINLDWALVYQGRCYQKTALPLYPFDKKSYRLPAPNPPQAFSKMGHWLLGEKQLPEQQSASNDQPYQKFVATITSESPSFLADHLVMGQIIFPGAAYIEIVLALQNEIFGDCRSIKKLKIIEPLILSYEESCCIETHFYQEKDSKYLFKIMSVKKGNGEDIRRLHARGFINREKPTIDCHGLEDFLTQETGKIKKADILYTEFESIGLQYGPCFQKLKHASCIDESHIVAHLHPYEANTAELINPTLLDAVMQSTICLLNVEEEAYLPIEFTQFHFFKQPRGHTRSVVKLRSNTVDDNKCLIVDAFLVDDFGPVFYVEGVRLKQVPRSQRISKTLVHKTQWVKKSLQEQADAYLGKQLVIGYIDSTLISLPEVTQVDSIEQAMSLLRGDEDYAGISYCWPTEQTDNIVDMATVAQSHYQSIIDLVKQLDAEFFDRDLSMYLLTRNSQIIPTVDSKQDMLQDHQLLSSSLWGFGASLLNEHPKLSTCVIDIDQNSNLPSLLSAEWSINHRQDFRVAYCDNQRFIQRIKACQQGDESENQALTIEDYGMFSNIKLKDVERVAPTEGQVQIQVKAAGLNFKDVLNALGMLKEHAQEMNVEYTELPLGFECSGIVVGVGDTGAEFCIGDEVIVSQVGCMQRYITVNCDVVVHKPINISFEEAAGLPTAYITAYYSLHSLANLQENERVLIHAGAGGVGQASIQLAKRMGAEIFATSSPHKWPLLEQQGVDHIMNSRTLEFAEQIHQLTQGEGVDVVVNSLNKEFITKGFQSTADGGRFIELGKIGVWDTKQASRIRADVNYHNFDLGEFPQDELNTINKDILAKVVKLIDKGELKPLPTMVYSVDEAEEAFSILSRGTSVGKVIISFEQEELRQPQPLSINPDHNILITGGTGALGVKTAAWLTTLGAKNIVLMGRRPVEETSFNHIKQMVGQDDVTISYITGDVAKEADVKRIINDIQPLGGIIHAAGVLADGSINNLTWSDFNKVFNAKIYGSYLLHKYTCESKSLGFFVAYSSVSSMLGANAQSNYAAANSYIDQLMQWRCAQGLPGLSIQWGPWADVGMAASLSGNIIRSIEDKGVKFLKPAQGVKLMESLLIEGVDNRAIGEFDWPRYYAHQVVEQSLFDSLLSSVQDDIAQFDLAKFESLPALEQCQKINELIRSRAAKILQFDSSNDIEIDARFTDLGLDSLVVVELKNALESCFKVPLQVGMLYDYPSINALSEYLHEQLTATTGKTVNSDDADETYWDESDELEWESGF